MKSRIAAAGLAFICLFSGRVAAESDPATLFRLFLRDGSSLVSYGEYARVGDRVVFSMPTAATPQPPLTLVNLAADRVDWERTARYAETIRADRYTVTRAESDFAALSDVLAQALNQVAFTADPARRLAIVEGARKTLAEWPPAHYYYRLADVRQMVSMLDEAIADLRASAGGGRFDLSLVALAEPPPASSEPLLPALTPKDAIEQTLLAARIADSPAERVSLLHVALAALDRDAASLPVEFAAAAHAATATAIAEEARTDAAYQAMVRRLTLRAERRARLADVRGIVRVLDHIPMEDAALGRRRPDVVSGLVAAVEAELDAARQLRLAQERWALRAPVLNQYMAAMRTPLGIFASLERPLRDIKELAGSSQGALARVEREVGSFALLVAGIAPPEEVRTAHALLASAAELAKTAASIRREAAVTGKITRAWDASSAAAGALLLAERARADIQASLRPPRLP